MLKQYFPNKEFKGLLFDFDGTVADTMGAHLVAWNKGLSAYNLTLSREQHLAWAGRPTYNIVGLLNEMHNTQIPVEQFLKDKEVHYLSSLHEVKAIEPVADFIKHYHGKIPMAIVTGSRRKMINITLEHLNLTNYFDLLVCAEDYKNGKPAPDCFLQAADKLNLQPADCLVFEDALLGVEAALNAGMDCLRLIDDRTLITQRR
ncbi:MAG: HAD family hydrolase [Bacillota bacterium]